MSDSAWVIKSIYSGGKERTAIRGCDQLPTLPKTNPSKAQKSFQSSTWLFSSKENMKAFQNNSEAYKPQYGGYCAYAVTTKRSASIKPQFFTIHEGKVYLNFSDSVHKKWNKERNKYISDADKHWPAVLAK